MKFYKDIWIYFHKTYSTLWSCEHLSSFLFVQTNDKALQLSYIFKINFKTTLYVRRKSWKILICRRIFYPINTYIQFILYVRRVLKHLNSVISSELQCKYTNARFTPRYPEMVCLIKYGLDLDVYNFKY